MSWPPPDRRDRLVWFAGALLDGAWNCACGLGTELEDVALRHAARCPVVANRHRFATIRAQREVTT